MAVFTPAPTWAQQTIDQILLPDEGALLPAQPEGALTAPAQSGAATPTQNKAMGTPLEDIPEEYIQEAIAFHQRCSTTSHMMDHYNCECLAAEFFDMRVALGPNIPSSNIALRINDQCLDATNSAGRRYNDCMARQTFIPAELNAEQYCECVANTYATLFERQRARVNSRSYTRLQAQAMTTCRDPVLARRFFPQQPTR